MACRIVMRGRLAWHSAQAAASYRFDEQDARQRNAVMFSRSGFVERFLRLRGLW